MPSVSQRMEPVLNPLFDASSLKSPQRAVPRPALKHQQQQHDQQHDQPMPVSQPATPPAAARLTQWRRACCRGTPWLVVLGVAVLIAAQLAWSVYMERFVASARQLLDMLHVSTPAELSNSLFILKAVLVGVTSFLGGVLLLLGVVVKKQRLEKRAATTRAEWPHGCRSHVTVSLAIALSLLLWLIAAGCVGLLCCTFTATGAALAGDLAAGHALSLAASWHPPSAGPTVQQLQASMRTARTAFLAASRAAPPVIGQSPWFSAMNGSVLPALTPGGSGGEEQTQQIEQSSCPATCLNLRLLTSLLQSSNSSTAGCVCIQAGIQEAQQVLNTMWRDGLAAMAAVTALAVIATWLLVYCLVACLVTWRDHCEAQHCRHLLQQEEQRDGHISRWMWTTGVASPHSASETLSSFPAFEVPTLDTQRPPRLMATELTGGSGSGSPSPRKHQAKWGAAAAGAGAGVGGAGVEQHYQQSAVRDQQADDIERPAQTPPDQLPSPARAPAGLTGVVGATTLPIPQLPASPQCHHSDQLQAPTATPVPGSLLGGHSNGNSGGSSSRAAGGVGSGQAAAPHSRREASRAGGAPQSSASMSSNYRRRWQDSLNARR